MGAFIREEIDIFLQAACYGMAITAAYDVLRILRRVFRQGDILVGIQDFVFWCLAGVVIFSMIFQCNDGILRGYILVALMIGGYLYQRSVGWLLVRYLSKFLNFFVTFLLKKPFKWVTINVRKLIKWFLFPFRKQWQLRRAAKLQKKAQDETGNRKKNNGKCVERHERKRKYHDKKKEKRKTGHIPD